MAKIKLNEIIDNYKGYVVEFSNGQFITQNSNDMGMYFDDYEESENYEVDLEKVINYKDLEIALIKDKTGETPWEGALNTIEEALEELAQCYGK